MQIEFIPHNYPTRQLAINDFSQKVKNVICQDSPRSFNHEQMIVMLLELAKNTFDHSNGIGILGMQLPSTNRPVLITYKDTGCPFNWEANSILGVSSKVGNGINFGTGLALVQQGAIGAGFELSIERIEKFTQFQFKRSVALAQT